MPGEPGRARVPQWFADLLANRHWVRRTRPFPHIYARDVFVPDFYRRLTEEFERVRRDDPALLRPYETMNDRAAVPLAQLRDGPLAVFLSAEWHDMIAGIAGVATTGDVTAALLADPPGTPSGQQSNACDSVRLSGAAPQPGEVRVHDESRPAGAEGRACVRAIHTTFYLGNAQQPSDRGGTTELYESTSATGARTIAPLGNSLVLFPCTPRSRHAFRGTDTEPCQRVVSASYRSIDATSAGDGQ